MNIGERLRELIPKLREADAQLNDAFERLEDIFEIRLPQGSYGRILLSRPGRLSTEWTHFVYDEGLFWIETWNPKHGFHTEDVMKHDVRADRIEAARRIGDLWLACGGAPLR